MGMTEAIERAINLAGGPAALARGIGGITSQAVSQWKKCPPERVLEVERLTGVSRHDLRPDIFGPSPAQIDAMLEAQGLRITDATPTTPTKVEDAA